MERRVLQTNFKVYYETTTNKTKWRTHRSMNQVSPKFKPGKEVVNRLDKSTNAKKGRPCQQPVFKELASQRVKYSQGMVS